MGKAKEGGNEYTEIKSKGAERERGGREEEGGKTEEGGNGVKVSDQFLECCGLALSQELSSPQGQRSSPQHESTHDLKKTINFVSSHHLTIP